MTRIKRLPNYILAYMSYGEWVLKDAGSPGNGFGETRIVHLDSLLLFRV